MKPVTREEAIAALTAAGIKLADARRLRVEAMTALRTAIDGANQSGLFTVAEIARRAGVSRVTVYAILARP